MNLNYEVCFHLIIEVFTPLFYPFLNEFLSKLVFYYTVSRKNARKNRILTFELKKRNANYCKRYRKYSTFIIPYSPERLIRYFRSKLLIYSTKVRLYKTLIKPVLMYGSETWVLNENDQKNLVYLNERYLERYMGQ